LVGDFWGGTLLVEQFGGQRRNENAGLEGPAWLVKLGFCGIRVSSQGEHPQIRVGCGGRCGFRWRLVGE
jgi:hypothetical protein